MAAFILILSLVGYIGQGTALYLGDAWSQDLPTQDSHISESPSHHDNNAGNIGREMASRTRRAAVVSYESNDEGYNDDADDVKDLSTRKPKAYVEPGLEKDTDEIDRTYLTLEQLNRLVPGPGVKPRREMPKTYKGIPNVRKRRRPSNEEIMALGRPITLPKRMTTLTRKNIFPRGDYSTLFQSQTNEKERYKFPPRKQFRMRRPRSYTAKLHDNRSNSDDKYVKNEMDNIIENKKLNIGARPLKEALKVNPDGIEIRKSLKKTREEKTSSTKSHESLPNMNRTRRYVIPLPVIIPLPSSKHTRQTGKQFQINRSTTSKLGQNLSSLEHKIAKGESTSNSPLLGGNAKDYDDSLKELESLMSLLNSTRVSWVPGKDDDSVNDIKEEEMKNRRLDEALVKDGDKTKKRKRWTHDLYNRNGHTRVYTHLPSSVPRLKKVQVVVSTKVHPTGLQRLDHALLSIKHESAYLKAKAQLLRKKLRYALLKRTFQPKWNLHVDDHPAVQWIPGNGVPDELMEIVRPKDLIPVVSSVRADSPPVLHDHRQYAEYQDLDGNLRGYIKRRVFLKERKRRLRHMLSKLSLDLHDLASKFRAYDMLAGTYRLPYFDEVVPAMSSSNNILQTYHGGDGSMQTTRIIRREDKRVKDDGETRRRRKRKKKEQMEEEEETRDGVNTGEEIGSREDVETTNTVGAVSDEGSSDGEVESEDEYEDDIIPHTKTEADIEEREGNEAFRSRRSANDDEFNANDSTEKQSGNLNEAESAPGIFVSLPSLESPISKVENEIPKVKQRNNGGDHREPTERSGKSRRIKLVKKGDSTQEIDELDSSKFRNRIPSSAKESNYFASKIKPQSKMYTSDNRHSPYRLEMKLVCHQQRRCFIKFHHGGCSCKLKIKHKNAFSNLVQLLEIMLHTGKHDTQRTKKLYTIDLFSKRFRKRFQTPLEQRFFHWRSGFLLCQFKTKNSLSTICTVLPPQQLIQMRGRERPFIRGLVIPMFAPRCCSQPRREGPDDTFRSGSRIDARRWELVVPKRCRGLKHFSKCIIFSHHFSHRHTDFPPWLFDTKDQHPPEMTLDPAHGRGVWFLLACKRLRCHCYCTPKWNHASPNMAEASTDETRVNKLNLSYSNSSGLKRMDTNPKPVISQYNSHETDNRTGETEEFVKLLDLPRLVDNKTLKNKSKQRDLVSQDGKYMKVITTVDGFMKKNISRNKTNSSKDDKSHGNFVYPRVISLHKRRAVSSEDMVVSEEEKELERQFKILLSMIPKSKLEKAVTLPTIKEKEIEKAIRALERARKKRKRRNIDSKNDENELSPKHHADDTKDDENHGGDTEGARNDTNNEKISEYFTNTNKHKQTYVNVMDAQTVTKTKSHVEEDMREATAFRDTGPVKTASQMAVFSRKTEGQRNGLRKTTVTGPKLSEDDKLKQLVNERRLLKANLFLDSIKPKEWRFRDNGEMSKLLGLLLLDLTKNNIAKNYNPPCGTEMHCKEKIDCFKTQESVALCEIKKGHLNKDDVMRNLNQNHFLHENINSIADLKSLMKKPRTDPLAMLSPRARRDIKDNVTSISPEEKELARQYQVLLSLIPPSKTEKHLESRIKMATTIKIEPPQMRQQLQRIEDDTSNFIRETIDAKLATRGMKRRRRRNAKNEAGKESDRGKPMKDAQTENWIKNKCDKGAPQEMAANSGTRRTQRRAGIYSLTEKPHPIRRLLENKEQKGDLNPSLAETERNILNLETWAKSGAENSHKQQPLTYHAEVSKTSNTSEQKEKDNGELEKNVSNYEVTFQQAYEKLLRAKYRTIRLKTLDDSQNARVAELNRMSKEADHLLSQLFEEHLDDAVDVGNDDNKNVDDDNDDIGIETDDRVLPRLPTLTRTKRREERDEGKYPGSKIINDSAHKTHQNSDFDARASPSIPSRKAVKDSVGKIQNYHTDETSIHGKEPAFRGIKNGESDVKLEIKTEAKQIDAIHKSNRKIPSNGGRMADVGQTRLEDWHEEESMVENGEERSDDEDRDDEDDDDDDDDDDDVEDDDDDSTGDSEDVQVDGKEEEIEVDENGIKQEPDGEFAFVEEKMAASKHESKELSWGEWSPCSKTCGLGERFRSNLCGQSNPCTGKEASTEVEICTDQYEC